MAAAPPRTQAAAHPRYAAEGLRCAVFQEGVATDVRVEAPSGRLEERTGRAGRLQLRATPGARGDLLRFEAWYDSLALWRAPAGGGRIEPDTDGLIGGRWRGRLGPFGAVQVDDRPFMPPAVLQAADLSSLLDDFLPPLAAVPLEPTMDWQADSSLAVRRLADSLTADGRRLGRYVWTASRYTPADSSRRSAERLTDEGMMVWEGGRGPVGWTRLLIIDTELRSPAGGNGSVRTRVEQRVIVTRVTDAPGC